MTDNLNELTDPAPDSGPLAMPTDPASQPVSHLSSAALVIASVWAVVAVTFAAVLLVGAQDVSYGGDAYTGIQNAVMLAVRGIAFLLFGSAALGFVIATRRDRQ